MEVVPMAPWLEAIPLSDDGADASDRIVERILSSRSTAEALTPQEGAGLRDLLGQVIVIHDARRSVSTLADGLGAFLILDVELPGLNEHLIVTTGSKNVCAALAVAWRNGDLPLACKYVETASKSNPGRSVGHLVLPDHF